MGIITPWSDQETERLKALMAEGASNRTAASTLNAEFGNNRTASAIAGLAYREKMPRTGNRWIEIQRLAKLPKPPKPPPAKKAPRVPQAARPTAEVEPQPETTQPDVLMVEKVIEVAPPVPESNVVPFLDIKKGQCYYVVEESLHDIRQKMCCGKKVHYRLAKNQFGEVMQLRSEYCATHHGLVYNASGATNKKPYARQPTRAY